MAMIEIKNLNKWYGNFQVLKNCNVTVEKGEVVVVCGPSGSGKSTLIKTVNALEPFQEGEIIVDGVSVGDPKTDLPKLRSRVGMVFQHFELFPHLSIKENLILAQMKVLGRSREESLTRGLKLLDRVGLLKHAEKYPGQLSGGQQQRVAIARALVTNPEIICLDEPLSNLDAKLRVQLRNELKDLQKRFGITTVYVTHDQEEALTLSDRIAVFNKGVIEQIGRPDEIYSHSATEFVCNFIGDINRLTPEFLAGTGADKVEGVDPKKHCYIRLERMHVNETMATDTLKTEAVVEDYEFYGLYIKYTVRAFGQTIKVIEKNSGKTLYKKGDTVTLSYNPADIMQYEG